VSRHVVATVDEVAEGTCKLVTVKGREIGVFNVAGRFYALANRCPHAGGSLCQGAIVGLILSDGPGQYRIARRGEFVRCPWHGWEYEISTGQSYCDPGDLKVRQYEISVAPGAELVKGPYVAESFPVSVEREYLLVEM
jgi:3-phenylpropionate/trans-cinnamate dioxygenase ferredoxin subunit